MEKNFSNKSNNSKELETDIDKVLNNMYPKNQQVKVRDYTPEILLINNVRNLPMLITQRHIKSIIYSFKEAKKLKLTTKNINYHGLGKKLFLKVINDLDNPKAVYKKDDNNYIIISKYKDLNNREIIIPVQINAIGRYKEEFVNENQIKSIYGRNNLYKYIENNKLELVYKKEELDFNEGIQYSNVANSST